MLPLALLLDDILLIRENIGEFSKISELNEPQIVDIKLKYDNRRLFNDDLNNNIFQHLINNKKYILYIYNKILLPNITIKKISDHIATFFAENIASIFDNIRNFYNEYKTEIDYYSKPFSMVYQEDIAFINDGVSTDNENAPADNAPTDNENAQQLLIIISNMYNTFMLDLYEFSLIIKLFATTMHKNYTNEYYSNIPTIFQKERMQIPMNQLQTNVYINRHNTVPLITNVPVESFNILSKVNYRVVKTAKKIVNCSDFEEFNRCSLSEYFEFITDNSDPNYIFKNPQFNFNRIFNKNGENTFVISVDTAAMISLKDVIEVDYKNIFNIFLDNIIINNLSNNLSNDNLYFIKDILSRFCYAFHLSDDYYREYIEKNEFPNTIDNSVITLIQKYNTIITDYLFLNSQEIIYKIPFYKLFITILSKVIYYVYINIYTRVNTNNQTSVKINIPRNKREMLFADFVQNGAAQNGAAQTGAAHNDDAQTGVAHNDIIPECSICCENNSGENLNSKKIIYIKSCKHTYHEDCINKWLDISVYCPNCKCDLRN